MSRIRTFDFARLVSRRAIAAVLLALGLALSSATSASAQDYDGWVYSEELGGWLDVNTGLVWGQDLRSYFGAYMTWSGADYRVVQYRTETGIPHWRLATVSELVDVSAKGGYQLLLASTGNNSGQVWSSQTKGKKAAYSVNVRSPSGTVSLYDKRSAINALPVYRAFTP